MSATYRIAFFLAAGLALAAGSYAWAANDEAKNTNAVLSEIERDPARRELARDAVVHARGALDRAAKLRAAGDETHARLADALAREWAEMAQDLLRAVEAEQRAASARLEATDAGARAERERSLLEEGIAHNGRLRAQLETVEHEKEAPPRTASVSLNSSDAGGQARDAGAKGTAADGGAR